jgi:4-aminobutyrate--pyruvate transaminase
MEALKIYEERDLFAHARRVAPTLQDGMRKFADHPLVGEIRGIGLIGAIELIKNKETKEAFAPTDGVGAFCAARAQENGLITRAMGDALGFCPPLVIDEKGINEILDIFGRSLDETLEMAQAKGLA